MLFKANNVWKVWNQHRGALRLTVVLDLHWFWRSISTVTLFEQSQGKSQLVMFVLVWKFFRIKARWKRRQCFRVANETLKTAVLPSVNCPQLETQLPTRFQCKCTSLSRIRSIKPSLGGKKTFRKRIVVYTNSLLHIIHPYPLHSQPSEHLKVMPQQQHVPSCLCLKEPSKVTTPQAGVC